MNGRLTLAVCCVVGALLWVAIAPASVYPRRRRIDRLVALAIVVVLVLAAAGAYWTAGALFLVAAGALGVAAWRESAGDPRFAQEAPTGAEILPVHRAVRQLRSSRRR